jgi:hypothetical protein
MRKKVNNNISIFIFILFSLTGCHSGSDKTVARERLNKFVAQVKQVHTAHERIIPQKSILPKKTVLQIPAYYKPIKQTAQFSNNIGTAENPTIEGGIINSFEHVVISQNIASEKTKDQQIETYKFANKPIKNSESFSDNWTHSSKVRMMLINAAKRGKLEYVLKKADQMQLPASIAIVPMVESNYNASVISPKGAGGAWQLMPDTAKSYGIENQKRFEFNSSTVVALKLLKDLYNQFGNWELAFAAYNAGSKRVLQALEKNPQAKSIEDLELPRETKIYVKRIMNINQSLERLATNVN